MNATSMTAKFATLALIAVLTFGCGGGDSSGPKPPSGGGGTSSTSTNTTTDANLPEWKPPADAVTLTGTVTFKGNAPRRKPIQVTDDCQKLHGENAVLSEDVVVKDGKLADAYVYVKNPPKFKFAAPSQPATLDQKGCQYVPHVLGMISGQDLQILNSDPLAHNVHKPAGDNGNPEFNKGMDKGAPPIVKKIQFAGVAEKREFVKCDIHGWMGAYVHVSTHPFFAVSKEDGTFEIKDLPPGEYELEAYHEKLGKRTAKVKIPDQKTVHFEFEPK